MSDGLVRVTAAAGGRRCDLAVPGGVALAELVPDLARAVGLLDPAAAYAGYRVLAHGRRLRPDRGLREQGVVDGALLTVAAVADEEAPPVHDDLAEATAGAVREQRAWQEPETRRTTLAAGLCALAGGGGIAVAEALRGVPWSLPAGCDPAVVAAVALVLVVLAGNAVPAVAVAAGVARADGPVVDPERVGTMVRRSARVLVAGSTVVGAVATLLAPWVVTGPRGLALALTCCFVLLLRARRHHAFAPALADVAGGLGVVVAVVATAAVRQPGERPLLAVVLVAAGCGACALSRLPAGPPALRARAADVLETLALVALAPLLLVATGGLAAVTGG